MSNDLGTYTQSFTIPISGLEIAATCGVPLDDHGIKATLSTVGGQLEATLEIPNIDEASAPQLAIRVASLLRDALVLEFAKHVEHVGYLKPSGSRFNPNSQPGSPRIRIAAADELSISLGEGVSPYRPDSLRLRNVARGVAMRLQVGEIPTSADLYTAKEMFRVGMQSTDKVARFLVLYSAVGLMVMFKDSSKQPSQPNVDELLKSVNASLHPSPAPSGPRKGKPEGPYSKLRNDFVHAEERNKNPSAARTAIEANIKVFQRDVAELLKSS
jgi:hypothetical protein